MKKVLAVVLCICMAAAIFGGCSKTTSSTATSNTGSTVSASSGTTLTDAEKAIADRKASGKNTKIVFCFYDWVGAPAGLDRIEGLINDVTEDKLGIEVDLQCMDATTFRTNVPLMCASGEQLDLFPASGLGLVSAVNNGYLYDLNENDLLNKYGSGITDTMDKVFLNTCSVGGTLYAIPTNREMGIAACIVCIAAKYLDGIGYDYDSKWSDENKESIPATWDDLEKIFADLAAKYPDKTVFSSSMSYLSQGNVWDNIGGDWFGVLLDPINSLKVSDVWSSDAFMDACKRFYKYNQLGYFPADCLTTTVTMGAQVGAGTAMSMMSQGKPGYRTQVSAECSMDMICFQVGPDIIKSTGPAGVCWSINQNCADPVAAMQLLNEFYTNADLSNLLCYGEEGKDYVVESDGRIGFPSGVDSKNSEWYHAVQWQMPNELIAKVWNTNSADVWERILKWNKTAARSKALGFTWDNSKYVSQYTALSNVYSEYYKSLILGCVDPTTTIPEYVEKLKGVGLDEYISAKTEALNAWAKENGVS